MRLLALGCAVLMAGCAAKNDPELVKRISVTAALDDVRAGVTSLSKGLLRDDVFLGVQLCTIKVDLALSANATQDNHAGLAVTAGYSGVSATGSANTNSSAADQRGNTVELVFRSKDITACPPQEAAPATAKAEDSAPTKKPANASPEKKPPVKPNPVAGTCFDYEFQKKNPARADETTTAWLRRICGGNVWAFPPEKS